MLKIGDYEGEESLFLRLERSSDVGMRVETMPWCLVRLERQSKMVICRSKRLELEDSHVTPQGVRT